MVEIKEIRVGSRGDEIEKSIDVIPLDSKFPGHYVLR